MGSVMCSMIVLRVGTKDSMSTKQRAILAWKWEQCAAPTPPPPPLLCESKKLGTGKEGCWAGRTPGSENVKG